MTLAFDQEPRTPKATALPNAPNLIGSLPIGVGLAALLFSLLCFELDSASAAEKGVPEAVRKALSEVLGAYDTNQAGGVVLRLNKADGIYRDGDRIAFEVIPPNEPTYIYLDYYQIDGNVVHLLPDPGAEAPRHATGRPLHVGQAGNGLQFEILPPFGDELIVAIAAPRPLVSARREFESATLYQEALRSGIARLRGSGQASRISVQIRPISTYAKDAEIPAPKPVAVAAVPQPEPEPKAAAPKAEAPASRPEEKPPEIDVSQMPEAPKPKMVPAEPAPALEQPKPAVKAAEPAPENGAAKPAQTAALPPQDQAIEGDSDSLFKARIRKHLNRMRKDPGDEENLAELIATYQEYAGNLIGRDEFSGANRQLEMALALDPLNDRTAVLIQAAETKVALRESLEAATGHLEAKDYDQAYVSLERVLDLEPNNPLAKEKLPEIRDQAVAQFHRRAMTAFRREQLDDAITLWDKLLVIEPEHRRATMYRSLAVDLKSRLQELETE